MEYDWAMNTEKTRLLIRGLDREWSIGPYPAPRYPNRDTGARQALVSLLRQGFAVELTNLGELQPPEAR
jgi:hypothetical protein